MVSSDENSRCCAVCRRLFFRSRPQSDLVDEAMPVTMEQLAQARDVQYTESLKDPLAIGSHIVITGTPCEDIPWFAVNIGTGAGAGSLDIAVHFNVRVSLRYVVRNTKRHGKWGLEETTSFRSFPFKAGSPFTIEILIDETETLFSVDGEHYCAYAHRKPSPLDATWIEIKGLKDTTLTINKTDVYPILAPNPHEVPLRPSIDSLALKGEPIWRANIIATLPNGIPIDHQLVVQGRLRPLLHSFTIDLLDIAREWPAAGVHAHVDVRAHDEAAGARQLVVLNARFGAWGAERRQRTASLVPGTKTTFKIVRAPNEWAVFADNLLIGELDYRADANGVRAVRVRGDLYPEQVYLCPVSASPVQHE